jgi:hypothetical protein
MPVSAVNLQYLLQEINALRRQLGELPPLPEAVRAAQRVYWVYQTCALTGDAPTYTDVELLLRYGQTPARPYPAELLQRVRNLAAALDEVLHWAAEPGHRLDCDELVELHRRLVWRSPGAEQLAAVVAAVDPEKVRDLTGWYRVVNFDNHPIVAGAELCFEVVSERPFGSDGNEELAVLLLNYHLARHGFPLVTLRADDYAVYRTALERARPGDLAALSEYLARQLVYALETTLQSARGDDDRSASAWEYDLARLAARLLEPGDPALATPPREQLPARLHDTVLPLCQLVLARLSRFDALFEQRAHTIRLRHPGVEQPFDAATYAEVLPQVRPETIESITLELCWKGFRPAPAFALNAALIIGFEQNQYELWFPSRLNVLQIQPYDVPLTESELRRVVDAIGSYLVGELETRS